MAAEAREQKPPSAGPIERGEEGEWCDQGDERRGRELSGGGEKALTARPATSSSGWTRRSCRGVDRADSSTLLLFTEDGCAAAESLSPGSPPSASTSASRWPSSSSFSPSASSPSSSS